MLNITQGRVKSAIKTVIAGSEGIGKSTLAAKFPDPLFIDTEGVTKSLDIKRVVCKDSWDELIQIVKEVQADISVCKTLVLDTADWAEILCKDYICTKYRQANIDAIPFGKGYSYLQDEFAILLKELDKLIELGINVTIIAHAKPRKYELPEEQGQFDRWEMKLTKQVAPLVKEWCDMLLFCNYKTFVVSTDNDSKKAQGGKRVIYTSHHPCWDAKNRFNLPDELDLDFTGISHLFKTEPAEKKAVKKESTANPTLEKLQVLMTKDGVTADEVVGMIVARGDIEEGQALEDVHPEYLAKNIIPNWTKIVAYIKKSKNNGGNN